MSGLRHVHGDELEGVGNRVQATLGRDSGQKGGGGNSVLHGDYWIGDSRGCTNAFDDGGMLAMQQEAEANKN